MDEPSNKNIKITKNIISSDLSTMTNRKYHTSSRQSSSQYMNVFENISVKSGLNISETNKYITPIISNISKANAKGCHNYLNQISSMDIETIYFNDKQIPIAISIAFIKLDNKSRLNIGIQDSIKSKIF